jgi:hypothetical protein
VGTSTGNTTGSTPTTGGTGGTGTGTSGGGGVSGSTATGSPSGEVLANTGAPVSGGLVGALMVLIGGIGMRLRKR